MRVTREDVAREAGVSNATVSYVLNGTRHFSDATVQRVHAAVKKLGYKPDMIARSMVKSETHQLGIVFDNILNPYYGEIVLGFENEAVKNGYFINICSGQNNLDGYFDTFISRRIDGLLILALPDKFHIEKLYDLADAGIKIVSGGIDNIDLKRISLLDGNYGEGMLLAYNHLYDLGHRKIIYLSALQGIEQSDSRERVFLKELEKHGVSNPRQNVVKLDLLYKSGINDGYQIAKKLLMSGKEFTAVICTNDLMAIGAIKAFHEAGLSVPKDISVVGFDNLIYSQCWSPSITSVSHNTQDFGKKACEMLLNNIRSGITGFYKATVSLYIGQSTAPPCK